MKTDDFDYELPPELIAQAPAEPRDSCRLLVLDKRSGAIEHRVFTDIIDYLDPGDLLVANETRVMPARLLGHKRSTGGAAEVLLLKQTGDDTWEALVKPGRRLQPGAVVEFRRSDAAVPPADASVDGDDVMLTATIVEHTESRGERVVRLCAAEGMSIDQAVHAVGHVPLPPYINGYNGDPEQYQTVYASREASAAAPTAGLHFTPELLERIKAKGVGWETVDLEVGVDTFRLVDEDDPRQHHMHTELYTVPQRVVDAVHETHAAGHRVIAVGTTSTRSLESAWEPTAGPLDSRGEPAGDLVAREHEATSLYILPGYTFHVIDALITNFHVPRSTLVMLVSALAGREHILNAYAEAVEKRYRFFSFGDAMLIK
jgi:S-adenosylmethionine:tRNA ribosyltransferase-isomerase